VKLISWLAFLALACDGTHPDCDRYDGFDGDVEYTFVDCDGVIAGAPTSGVVQTRVEPGSSPDEVVTNEALESWRQDFEDLAPGNVRRVLPEWGENGCFDKSEGGVAVFTGFYLELSGTAPREVVECCRCWDADPEKCRCDANEPNPPNLPLRVEEQLDPDKLCPDAEGAPCMVCMSRDVPSRLCGLELRFTPGL
jgi:hypothetical protein